MERRLCIIPSIIGIRLVKPSCSPAVPGTPPNDDDADFSRNDLKFNNGSRNGQVYGNDAGADRPRFLSWRTLIATPPLKAPCLETKEEVC